MQVGIYTKTFSRPTLDATLDAVQAHDIHYVQFNLANAGLPTLPDRLDGQTLAEIRSAFDARGISVAAVSGTFNIINPDARQRQADIERLRVVADACRALGANVVTLSTGTRDAENMWRAHPDNATPEAWAEAAASLRAIAAIGEEHGVAMAFEPEVSNVVDSAQKARRMLDEVGSPHLKVVMDGANIFPAGSLPRMAEVLDEAFALLGADIALAHAKDLTHDGDAGNAAAGHGLLDYDRYVRLLQQSGYTGPLVLHGLSEDQIDGCVAFLRGKLAAIGAG